MKVLIVCYSETSNSKRVAESIYEEVSKMHEVELKRLNEVKIGEFHEYNFIFTGSTCHDSDLAKPMIRFLEAIPENPSFSMAGFYTHKTYTRDYKKFKRIEELFDKWAAKGLRTFERISREKGIEYKGHFNCMGAPNPGIEAFIKNTIIQNEEEWDEYLEDVRKHPSSEDLENTKLFAKRVTTRARVGV
jgi:flavodoxin I